MWRRALALRKARRCGAGFRPSLKLRPPAEALAEAGQRFELSHSEHRAANAPGATGVGYPQPPQADQGAMCPVDKPYVARSRSSVRLTTWWHSAVVRRSKAAAHDALSANRGKTGDSP